MFNPDDGTGKASLEDIRAILGVQRSEWLEKNAEFEQEDSVLQGNINTLDNKFTSFKIVSVAPTVENAEERVLYLVNSINDIYTGYYLITDTEGNKSIGQIGGRSYSGGTGISIDAETATVTNTLATSGGNIGGAINVNGKITGISAEINGDLTVNGDIIQNGESYETHAEKVYTKDDFITLRDGAVSSLADGEVTGIEAKLYDGEHDGRLVFDKDGIARVGDFSEESDNTEPLATRDESENMGNDHFVKWDSENNRLVTADNTSENTPITLELTKTEYDALSDEEKEKNIMYVVKDEEENNFFVSSIPIGTIMPYASSSLPSGFLLCDGSEVSRRDYEALFTVIGTTYGAGDGNTTFNIPDTRENVLVGTSQNTTHNILAHDVYNLGEFKDDQFQGHWHRVFDSGYTPDNGSANGWGYGRGGSKKDATTIKSDDVNGTPRIGSTTHGKQLGINYIIKATNYGYVCNNAIDDTKATKDNVWSGEKVAAEIETVDNKNNYSTEETVVGEWIDGRPLYRKVINFSYARNFTKGDFILSSAEVSSMNIDMLIKAFAWNTSKVMIVIQHIFLNSGAFKGWNGASEAGNMTSCCIEYTKTTD